MRLFGGTDYKAMWEKALEENDRLSEGYANVCQLRNEAERRADLMTLLRREDGMCQLALDVTHVIEDIFINGCIGGRAQRNAKVQTVLQDAFSQLMGGKRI